MQSLSHSLLKCGSSISRSRNATRLRRCQSTVEKKVSSNVNVNANANANASATGRSSSVPIGASMAAALAGVSVVTVGAAAVEISTADSCLPYSANGQRFDQDSFQGRFSRMLLACDPRLLFYSAQQVQQAQALLEKADQYADDRSMDRTLWEARRVVDAALHPDTGDSIPHPFRMSGYVPFNGPICVAMVASTTTSSLLFWSWINQSQNALVNYYNRNASSPMSNETLLVSYSAAVGSALVVAFGLSTFIQKKFAPEKAKQLMKFAAFPSAVVASSLNCYIVRSPEIESGIPLMDEHQNAIMLKNQQGEMVPAISQQAATRGVNSTTVSRAILQAPVYFLPAILIGLGPFAKIVAARPHLRVPMTTCLVLTSFGLGLPTTVAMFPQIASIEAEQVEPAYQNLINPRTKTPYTVYYYNKGL